MRNSRWTHRLRSGPLLVCAAYAVLLVVWVWTNPPFAGADEPAHYVRAIGIGQGKLVGPLDPYPSEKAASVPDQVSLDWVNDATRSVIVPPGRLSGTATCEAGHPALSAACQAHQGTVDTEDRGAQPGRQLSALGLLPAGLGYLLRPRAVSGRPPRTVGVGSGLLGVSGAGHRPGVAIGLRLADRAAARHHPDGRVRGFDHQSEWSRDRQRCRVRLCRAAAVSRARPPTVDLGRHGGGGRRARAEPKYRPDLGGARSGRPGRPAWLARDLPLARAPPVGRGEQRGGDRRRHRRQPHLGGNVRLAPSGRLRPVAQLDPLRGPPDPAADRQPSGQLRLARYPDVAVASSICGSCSCCCSA